MNKHLIGFLSAFFICFFLFQVINSKIQIILHTTNNDITIYTDGSKAPITSDSLLSNNSLEIINAGENPKSHDREIHFTAPKTIHGGTIYIPSLYKTVGDWKVLGDLKNNGRWFSTKTGSSISYRGNTSDLTLPILKHPKAGIAKIIWNGRESTVDLYSDHEEWVSINLPSQGRIIASSIPITTKSVDIRPDNENYVQYIEVSYGNKILYKGEYKQVLDLSSKHISILSYLLVNILITIVEIFFLWIIAHFIGKIVLIWSKTTYPSIIYTITGIGASAITITTLSYKYSVLTSTFIYIVFLLISTLASTLIFKKTLFKKSNQRTLEPWLILISVLIVLNYFFPSQLEPGWFFGHSYTDSFEYINQSQIFTKISPSLYGFPIFKLRFAESVILSLIAIILRVNTSYAYSVLGEFFLFLTPFICYEMLSILIKNKSIKIIGSITIASAANIYILFSQAYLAQYIFIISLLSALLTSLIFLQKPTKINKSVIFITAITYALSLLLYPYQFFLPLSLFLLSVLLAITHKNYILIKNVTYLAILTALFLNVNLLQILNFNSTSNMFIQQLNSIGKYIVFPFYKSKTETLSFLFGFKELSQNTLYAPQLFSALSIPSELLEFLKTPVSVLLILLGVIILFSLVKIKKTITVPLLFLQPLSILPLLPFYYGKIKYIHTERYS